MRLRAKGMLVILLMAIGLTFASVPDSQALGCKFDCSQGYDTATCWEYLWATGNMDNCQVVCDCSDWYCSCWCTGDRCYFV
jgi:hypothetical protein